MVSMKFNFLGEKQIEYIKQVELFIERFWQQEI